MPDIEKIYTDLKEKFSENQILLNANMKEYTSFKIGGNADILVTIKNEQEAKYVLEISKKNNCSIFVLGNGTNILVKDKGIRGIVLRNRIDYIEEVKPIDEDDYVEVLVGSGVKNSVLAQKLLRENLTGFEFASGIPGTIGGAIKMNAGAYGGEIKDILIETTYLDYDGNIHTVSNEECNFNYRYSMFKDINAIILSGKFKFKRSIYENIKEKMDQNEQARKEKQPIEFPNAGSTFKRGTDFITAKLIDECGLKGYKIGDAEVSQKHAGFVINRENAKAEDVIELINNVKEEVSKKFNKDIDLEIEIIGE